MIIVPIGSYIKGGGMNLMTNASATFELGTTGWLPRSGLSLSSSPEQAYSGVRSLKIFSDAGADQFQFGVYYGTALQDDEQDDFVATAWVFLPTAGGLTSVFLQYRDGGTNFYTGGTTYDSFKITTKDSWQKIVLPFTAKATSGQGILFFWAQGGDTGDYMYVDNIQVQRGRVATEFSPLTCDPLGNLTLRDGNFVLSPTATVDGVDISVHAENVSAHHAKYLNTEAVAAVLAADDYVKNTGDIITGALEFTGGHLKLHAGMHIWFLVEGTPKYTFQYKPASNYFTISEYGVADHFVIKNGGLFGFGVTNPTEKVDIAGNIGITGTVDGVDISAHAANPTAHHILGIVFNLGLATVGIKQAQALIPGPLTISKVKIYSDVAPVGASLIVDVNKNGVTIFTTQANRPAIPSGGHSDDSGTPNITSLAEGDRLSVDVDQVGSTTPGGNDLLVTIIC